MKLDTLTQIDTAMGAARQLIKGTTADKLAYLMKHLPQSVVDGQLINYNGELMGATDLEDQVLVKVERLSEAKQITDALMTDIFHPINTKVLLAGKDDEEETVDPKKDTKKEDSKSEQLADDEIQLIKAIKKGKGKKASALLKELNKAGALKKKVWKKYKKQIEGL